MDCDLHEVDQVVDFGDLREYAATKKPRRKKKSEQQQNVSSEDKKTDENKVDPMQFGEFRNYYAPPTEGEGGILDSL